MDPYLGEIRLCAFSYAPRGWALCNGALLNINQYQALYALLGPRYGGDGRTTFALPDLRGRVACGQSATIVLGEKDGAEAVALSTQQIPPHNHPFMVSSQRAKLPNVGDTGNSALAYSNKIISENPIVEQDGPSLYSDNSNPVALHAKSCGVSGNGEAHENMQPSLVLNYIIAINGIFPPRS